MEVFLNLNAWIALLTLTFLEIVLGVDNIIFISIAADKLEPNQRREATNIGLFLAMLIRIGLLFMLSILTALNKPFWNINESWISVGISGQALILCSGGIFLLYKSTKEIHEKVEDKNHDKNEIKSKRSTSLTNAVIQISMINLVFSFDSILTAIGMTNGISENPQDATIIMMVAVIVSMLIMMFFAKPVGDFVNQHPTIQMLGLTFLILIGFMLITEAAHISHLSFLGNEVGSVPKAYLYFAISFSLLVEFLNMKVRKKQSK